MIKVTSKGRGAQSRRYLEWITLPYADNAAVVWSRSAQVIGSGSAFTGSQGIPWNLLGVQAALVQRTVDQWGTILIRPAAAADCTYLWTPFGITGDALGFTDVFPPTVPGAGDLLPVPLATSIMAWIRKQTPAAATSSRQHFGFANLHVTATSGGTARAGLVGDGVLGFRFGSVNCPDSNSAAAENAITDIDANSVQPPELVSPGGNWFHVRIKIVPPAKDSPARWAAFLNGRNVATFGDLANFPRRTGVANPPFSRLYPFLGMWRNPNLDGLHLHDLRVVVEDDLTL